MCTKNGKYVKWYISNGHNPIYLPKSEQQLAKRLALKKYYSLQVSELSQELHSIDRFLAHYQKPNIVSETLLDDSSCYKTLLSSHFQTFSSRLQQWVSAEYEHCKKHPEHLIHKTLAGHSVRSKSEVIIANALFLSKIPYRYECALKLGNSVFFPDFTICHPSTMELFFWEHFGLMSALDYRNKTYNKLKIYGKYSIIPSINLITTFETQTHPVDSTKIQKIIQEYFQI